MVHELNDRSVNYFKSEVLQKLNISEVKFSYAEHTLYIDFTSYLDCMDLVM